ncbi:MAG: phosphatase PAP2 family protein [Micavibrio sp.]|nr:phosphatase PAP2 family protein [Micavibrio sp.]
MLHRLARWKQERIGDFAPTRNTVLVWSVMAALLAIDIIWLLVTGMAVDWGIWAVCLAQVVPLWCLAFVYTYLRRDARIATLAHGMTVALAFPSVAGVLSYLIVAAQRPLVDAQLAHFDDAIGLDWLTPFHWLVAHGTLYNIAFYAYSSLLVQYGLLVLVLNFIGRMDRCWELLWLVMTTCCVCLVFSAIWPAAGAFGYYHANPDSSYLKAFMKLHEGRMTLIGEDSMKGIIQFPSFHAVMAVVFMYVTRGIRWLFPAALVLNVMMLAATPAIGGHYYADVLAGLVVVAAAIWFLRKFKNLLGLGAVAVTAPA